MPTSKSITPADRTELADLLELSAIHLRQTAMRHDKRISAHLHDLLMDKASRADKLRRKLERMAS